MSANSESNRGGLVGRHVVRIMLNGSPPPPPPSDPSSKSKKKYSQSTSSLVANKSSQLTGCTCSHATSSLPSVQRENQLELAKQELRKLGKEKAEVEEEQGRLLTLNVELALENKMLMEDHSRLKLEMRRLEEENTLWKLQEADLVRANAELVFEVTT